MRLPTIIILFLFVLPDCGVTEVYDWLLTIIIAIVVWKGYKGNSYCSITFYKVDGYARVKWGNTTFFGHDVCNFYSEFEFMETVSSVPLRAIASVPGICRVSLKWAYKKKYLSTTCNNEKYTIYDL